MNAHIGFVSDRVLLAGDRAAGCGTCKKLGEISSVSKLASPLDNAQPIRTSAIIIFKKGNMFGSSFILENSRTEKETIHVDMQFSGEQAGRQSRAATTLWPMHMAGCMQPMEEPTLEGTLQFSQITSGEKFPKEITSL